MSILQTITKVKILLNFFHTRTSGNVYPVVDHVASVNIKKIPLELLSLTRMDFGIQVYKLLKAFCEALCHYISSNWLLYLTPYAVKCVTA